MVFLRGPRFFPLSDRSFRGAFIVLIGVPLMEVSVLMIAEPRRGAGLLFLDMAGPLGSWDGRFAPADVDEEEAGWLAGFGCVSACWGLLACSTSRC